MSKTLPQDPFANIAPPGLLVSVRDAGEAQQALAGGADWIDVKEPARGSLGAADRKALDETIAAVAGRVPVSAAAGELLELEAATARCKPLPAGVCLFKLGLAGCGNDARWPERWQAMLARLGGPQRGVAVAYADWQAACGPPPSEVLQAALEAGCPALLFDTFDKSAGNLFSGCGPELLRGLIGEAQHQGLRVVLAGSLSGKLVTEAVRLAPDLVAVRGAACEGDRRGRVLSARVAMVHDLLETSRVELAGNFLDFRARGAILEGFEGAR